MSDPMDTKLRELTYRLVEMAPEAPPYPEADLVQLQPTTETQSPRRQRNPLMWAAAAAAVALVVIGVPLVLFGPSSGTDPTTVPPATASTVPEEVAPTTVPEGTPTTVSETVGETVSFSVYLYSDDVTTRVGDPALIAVSRTETLQAVLLPDELAGLALDRLRDTAPPPGFSSAIPEGAAWTSIRVDDGVATINFTTEFASGGGTASMTARLAQVVFTATQFPEIDSVLFMIDGEVVDVFSAEGIVLDGPQTRADWFDDAQGIYLDTPAIGSIVTGTVGINGYANLPSGTVEIEITTTDGTLVNAGMSTITCGEGCWGEFAAAIPYTLEEDTEAIVSVFDTAGDGSRRHVMRYPVLLLASSDSAEGVLCSTLGLDLPLADQPGLPAPVAEMRQAIYVAAMACDIAALATLADAGDDPFLSSFGGDDALTYWTEAERRGEPILADLVRHLNLPFGVDEASEPTLYSWPSAQGATSLDEIPADEYAALLEMYSAAELENMYDVVGGYVGWRVGIDETPDWRYFVQGD